MSIIKFINSKNRGLQALKQGISYIMNPEKTSQNLIHGNGVSKNNTYKDMNTVQNLLGKETGRTYVHFVISFDRDVSAQKAYDVTNKCCDYFAVEYQYICAIHTNTENCHAHVILNTVNLQTGKKFSQSRAEMLEFRDFVNQCLVESGLNPIGQTDSSTLSYEFGILEEYEDFDDILDDDDIENDDIAKSFFGFVDPDEISQIRCAEAMDKDMKKIIHYFQGEAEELPPDMYYEEAELQYSKWNDGLKYLEEEDDKKGFFQSHIQ